MATGFGLHGADFMVAVPELPGWPGAGESHEKPGMRYEGVSRKAVTISDHDRSLYESP